MFEDRNVLCLILARGGSKGIKLKNKNKVISMSILSHHKIETYERKIYLLI